VQGNGRLWGQHEPGYQESGCEKKPMLQPFGLPGTILTAMWLLLSFAMTISPTKVFWLLGRRLPLSNRVILTFRVLGVVNALGCVNLLLARHG
jgi:hypothetical protein